MKSKIYKILIIILIILIAIKIFLFYRNKNLRKALENLETFSSEETEDNEIINVIINEKPIDSNSTDWNLILVNKENFIPEEYNIQTTKIDEKWDIDIRIKEAASQMLMDARRQGLDPIICSAYRTSQFQKELFNNKINEYKRKGYSQEEAEKQAALWVTIPGTSEHELGLSLDIVSNSYQILDENQENTKTQKWLIEHCYEYGFILRYPTEKKEITKINYEPWHYRYVGVKDAMFMKEKGFCLEEYIDFLKNYE